MADGARLAVYLACLDQLEPALESFDARFDVLTSDERARVTRLRAANPTTDLVPRRWATARLALRVVLQREGIAAARAPFATTPQGKPFVAGVNGGFSLSHAKDHALIAVGPSGQLGADLEIERTVALPEHRRSLMLAAAAAFVPGGQSRQDLAFLTAWTRLEACAKSTGLGIGAVLSNLTIWGHGSRPGTPDEVADRSRAFLEHHALAVCDLDAGAGLYAAIAAAPAALASVRFAPLTIAAIDEVAAVLAADCG